MDPTESGEDPDGVGVGGVRTSSDEFLEYLKSLAQTDANLGIPPNLFEEFLRNSSVLNDVDREFRVQVEPVSLNESISLEPTASTDEPELIHVQVTSPTVTSSGIAYKPEEEGSTVSSEEFPSQCSPRQSTPTPKSKEKRTEIYRNDCALPKESSSNNEHREEGKPIPVPVVQQSKQNDNLKSKPVSTPEVSSSSSSPVEIRPIRGENISKKKEEQSQRHVKGHHAPCPKSKKKLLSQCGQPSPAEPQQRLSSVANTSHGNLKKNPTVPCSTQQQPKDICSQKNKVTWKNVFVQETPFELKTAQTRTKPAVVQLKNLADLLSSSLTTNKTSIPITPRLLEEISQLEKNFGNSKVSIPEKDGKESSREETNFQVEENRRASSITSEISQIEDGRNDEIPQTKLIDKVDDDTLISITSNSSDVDSIGSRTKETDVVVDGTSSKENQPNDQVWPNAENVAEDPLPETEILTKDKSIGKENETITPTTMELPVEVVRARSASPPPQENAPTTSQILVNEITTTTATLPSQEVATAKSSVHDEISPSALLPPSHSSNAERLGSPLSSESDALMEPRRLEVPEPVCADNDDAKELEGGERLDNAQDRAVVVAGEVVSDEDEATEKRQEEEESEESKSAEDSEESMKRFDMTEIKQEKWDESAAGGIDMGDPEIPRSCPETNEFAYYTMLYLKDNPEPALPDVDVENNLAEITVMKVAWWISKGEFEDSKESGSRDDWYKCVNDKDNLDDPDADCNFFDELEFAQLDDEEIYKSLPAEIQRKTSSGPVDEHCGRQLLASKYRSDSSDKFSNIFKVRGFTHAPAEAYDKKNFQASCTLCDNLIIGKHNLASHILSDLHREKLSKAGMSNMKTADKKEEKGKESTSEVDKKSAESSEKNEDKKKSVASVVTVPEKKDIKKNDDDSKDKSKKNDEDSKDKSKKNDEEKDKVKRHKDKKRKRSKDKSSSEDRSQSRDNSGAEVGVTSTGLPIKIPAGAIPDKNKKRDSKDKRSRSRSPLHKRNRSRSPRHSRDNRDRDSRRRSKSRSPHGSRRRRSRSRERGRDRGRDPVVRISRSPGKSRRRSTSAEQAEKFLAKIKRRSRSPPNGHRKRLSPTPTASSLPKRTNKEFHEKLALTMSGKWTAELEKKWKLMEVQEAMFMEQFSEKRNDLKTTPENHPSYSEEWKMFWERRYNEVEQEGKDPYTYNYVPEWKLFWEKRLAELLNIEYEEEILKIKVQNGVDIDTLQRISNTPVHPVMPVLQSEPLQLQPQLQIPHPVPPPACLPMGVPPPIPHILMPQIQVPSITLSSSVSDIGGEDMVPRPMSISDGAEEHPETRNNVAPSVPSPVVTTDDIMSTWKKLKSGGIPAGKQGGVSVPAPRAPQPFLSLSRKDSDDKSTSDSAATIESYKFSTDIDVTQVLYKMSQLEDQLSFFADKVKEYFYKAEKMDLQKRNKSLRLLTDDDFVAMLYQIKDRFTAMIRARILPKDVLDKLNYAVYGLDGLMEHPECVKRRPRPVVTPPEIPPPEKEAATTARPNNVNDTFTRPSASSAQPRNPLRYLPRGKQQEIAGLVTSFLNFMGRTDLSDSELKELVCRLCQPTTSSSSKAPSFSGSTRNSVSSTPVHQQQSSSNRDSDSNSRSFARFDDNADSDPWRLPERNITKVGSVVSFRTAGQGAPQLPNVIPQFTSPTGGSGPIRFGPGSGSEVGGWGRGQNVLLGGDSISLSSGSSGRHSPFSRRDFSGNPVSANSANPYRDKAANTLDSTNPQHPGGTRVCKENQENHHVEEKMAMKTLKETKRDPEITMGQRTRHRSERQGIGNMKANDPIEEELAFHILANEDVGQGEGKTSRRTSIEEIIVGPNLPNVPPGIMNLIMQERIIKHRQQQKEEELIEVEKSLSDEPVEAYHYYRRGKRKRKRKEKRLREDHRSNSKSSSVEDSDDDASKQVRDRSKERRKRREKRMNRNERGSVRSSVSSPISVDEERERKSRRKTQSPLQDSRRESRKRRKSRRQSRSPPLESEERHPRGSKGDKRRVKRHESRIHSPTRPSSSKRSKSSRRRSQESGEVLSDPSVVRAIKRGAHSRLGEKNERKENRANFSSSPAKSEMSFVETGTIDQVAIRRAPRRDDQYSEDEMSDYSPVPLQQSSKSFLREKNLRSSALVSGERAEMFAPSPPASVNSGSSGYRRTKERKRTTTINVPKRCQLKPTEENWETLSVVSSLGEDKNHHKSEPSCSKSSLEKNGTEKPKVTSVSKMFWTEKDEDGKSLSSISNHDQTESAKKSQEPVDEDSGATLPIAEDVAPKTSLEKGQRNYRTSFDDDRESGEVSSSSADIGEL